MKLLNGRDFSGSLSTDSSAIILNETAIGMMGLGKDPLNKELDDGNKKYHIIGIVKDFNFNSLRNNITPLVLVMGHGEAHSVLCVRLTAEQLPALLAQVTAKWKQFSPGLPFDYSFMDQDFDAIYQAEQRMGRVFAAFATLAILIACLGLFGLAAYAAEQRNKEISIRKVLGANVSTIVALLSRDFIKLVMISILVATPLAWLIMYKWLQGFAYRQDMQWWVVVWAALGALLIAFATVSYQSVKAAIANPIKNLRSE